MNQSVKSNANPYLFMMLGHAGSGKSYFARQLAAEKNIIRLNGDSMRIAIFGSVEAARAQDHVPHPANIFGAIDYAFEQALLCGNSVIYDANHNKATVRKGVRELALKCGAVPGVTWVQTSKDLALQRTQERDEQIDQRKMNRESALEVVERHIAFTDEPSSEEIVILIDGTDTFEKQYESFKKQFAEIKGE